MHQLNARNGNGNVVQVVKSDLGNFSDVLIEKEERTFRNNTFVKSYCCLIKVVSLSSRGNDQHLSFIQIQEQEVF